MLTGGEGVYACVCAHRCALMEAGGEALHTQVAAQLTAQTVCTTGGAE